MTNHVRMSTLPYAKSKILVRLEDISDFMTPFESEHSVNLSQIADSLFKSANKKVDF